MLEDFLNNDPSDALRAAFRRHASGVAVITATSEDGSPVGFTATSMTSLGSNPPLVTFNVSRGSSAWPTISTTRHLALHMLGSSNFDLAQKMAADKSQRFIDSDWEFSEFGLPVFRDVTAVLFVRVREFHHVEQNAVFISDVVSGKLGSDQKALLYNKRAYFTPADTPL